jgi:hypothetical protein
MIYILYVIGPSNNIIIRIGIDRVTNIILL